jgi:hypothetical protein
MRLPEGQGKKKNRKLFQIITTESFSQISIRYQIIDPGRTPRRTNADCHFPPPKLYLSLSDSNCRKKKRKRKKFPKKLSS